MVRTSNTRVQDALMDSHFDADLLRARLDHVLNLIHLLLPKLFPCFTLCDRVVNDRLLQYSLDLAGNLSY